MLSIFILFLTLASFANAGLFVINPLRGSKCHGGQPCTVDWLDDGQNPLLTAIGVTTVGLYTGNQRLVQTITPVDVSKVHSLTFTPLPEAGPNSDTYYISFISTALKQTNNTALPYAAFSPFFQLDKMTGSFSDPNPTATHPIPVPSSLTSPPSPNTSGGPATHDGDVLTTITVGNLATTAPSPSPSSSSITTTAGAASGTRATTSGSGSATIATPTAPPASSALSSPTASISSAVNQTPSAGGTVSGFSTLVAPPSSGVSLPASSTVTETSTASQSTPSTNGAGGARSVTHLALFVAVLAGFVLVL